MQKSFLYQRSFRSYLIPILLFMSSFSIYSYNLGEQPSYGDEPIYLGWGGVYFDLIKKGDFDNPCLKDLKGCELLYDPEWKGHYINYTPVRNFFAGFGQYLTTGENNGEFYNWSCAWYSCWESEKDPTSEELSSLRFFSPIFGSLTIVLAFFIGKILFNRTTGLFFSLILLFSSLWLVHSRLLMTEVYFYFFIFLSIFLLLKSFKKENNHRIAYFIFGAISFGFALNTKLIAIEFVIPILVMILFYDSFNEKLNYRFFKKKKNLVKVSSLILIFFVISFISFVAIFPKYYDDTFNQLLKTKDDGVGFGFATLPTAEKNYLFHTLVTLQVTLLPYIMDSYLYDVFPDEAREARLSIDSFSNESNTSPSNYSTIPLSLFFFIGLIYLIKKIKTRNLIFSELAVLVWFTFLFIFIVLTINLATIERYYLPVMFPIMLIASYGLGRFIKEIQNQKEKILFFTSFIITHSLYVISFFDKIYIKSDELTLAAQFWIIGTSWLSPLPVSSQLALNDPLVYVSTITFIMIFVLIFIRIKTRIPVETRQARS